MQLWPGCSHRDWGGFLVGDNHMSLQERNPSPSLDKVGFCACAGWRSNEASLRAAGRKPVEAEGLKGSLHAVGFCQEKSIGSKIRTSWCLEEGKKPTFSVLKQNKNHWPAEEPCASSYQDPESAMLPLKSSWLSGFQPVWISWRRNEPPLPLPRGQLQLPLSLEPSIPVGSAGSSLAVQTSSGQQGCAIAPL